MGFAGLGLLEEEETCKVGFAGFGLLNYFCWVGFAGLSLLGVRKTCWVGLKSSVCKVVFVIWCLQRGVSLAGFCLLNHAC